MGLYRDYETRPPTIGAAEPDGLAPAWLLKPNAQAWLGAFGDQKDWVADLADQAVKARFAAIAPADALALLGAERQLVRGIVEDEASFRTRIQTAWELWQYGGTAYGMLRALASAGYPATILQTQTGKQYQLAGTTRTNHARYSEQFDQALWAKVNATITANAAVAPDGAVTMDKLCEDATASVQHRVTCTPSPALIAGVTYTFSVYARPGERDSITLRIGASPLARFDLTAGAVVQELSGATGAITRQPDGSYRCAVTVAAAGGEQTFINLAVGAATTYDGIAGNGAFVWGAQLEAGTAPTAYIPSLGATAQAFDLTVDAAGTPTMVTQDLALPVHLGGSPSELWSDIGVLLPKPWPTRWIGVSPADGTQEQKSFAELVRAWKPGHCRCVKIVVQDGNIWGFGGLTWGQASLKWGQGTTTTWTPPVG